MDNELMTILRLYTFFFIALFSIFFGFIDRGLAFLILIFVTIIGILCNILNILTIERRTKKKERK